MKNIWIWIIGAVIAAGAIASWRYLQIVVETVPGPMSEEFPPVLENRPAATNGFLFSVGLENPDGHAYYLAPFDGSGLWRLTDNPEGMSLASTFEHNFVSPEIAFIGQTITSEVVVTMRNTVSGIITNEFTIPKDDWGVVNGGVPTFVTESDDGSMLFFQNKGEERAVGAWRVDVKSGEVMRYDYLDKFFVTDVSYNPSTNQLIGVWYKSAEEGSDPEGPSAVHLIDGETGSGMEINVSKTDVYRLPTLSSNGLQYVVQTQNGNEIHLFDTKSKKQVDAVSGRYIGWHDELILLSDSGVSYSVYNTSTKQSRQIGDFQKIVSDWRVQTGRSNDSMELSVEYLGDVDISDEVTGE